MKPVSDPSADLANLEQLTQELASFLFDHCGTMAQFYGLESRELEAVYALGYALYNQGRWSDALQVFGSLVRHDHLDRRYQIAAANCLKMQRRFDMALRAYGVAHLLDVTDPHVVLQMGECLIALGNKEDAQAMLDGVGQLASGQPQYAAIADRARALCDLLNQ